MGTEVMENIAHPAISAWAIKKFDLPEGTTARVESNRISGGYCETCWYEYEVMDVLAKKPGSDKEELVHRYDEMDMATLLKDILGITS